MLPAKHFATTNESELVALHRPLLRFAMLQLRFQLRFQLRLRLRFQLRHDCAAQDVSRKRCVPGPEQLRWAEMKLGIDCKDMPRLMSEAQDISPPPARRARMRLHFVVCQTCRNINDQFGFLRRAMRQVGEKQEVDEAADK